MINKCKEECNFPLKRRLSRKRKCVSHSVMFNSLWPHGAHHAPLTMESFSSLGNLPDPEIEAGSPTLQADSLPSEPPGKHAAGAWGVEWRHSPLPSFPWLQAGPACAAAPTPWGCRTLPTHALAHGSCLPSCMSGAGPVLTCPRGLAGSDASGRTSLCPPQATSSRWFGNGYRSPKSSIFLMLQVDWFTFNFLQPYFLII